MRPTLATFHRGGPAAFLFVAIVAAAPPAISAPCGSGNYPFPFTDVGGVADAFCHGILHAYVVGTTRGATATTFAPNDPVTRQQMTTFLQRNFDQGLKRGHPRAALQRWWIPRTPEAMQAIPIPGLGIDFGGSCASDGRNVWATAETEVMQVDAGSGRVLGWWTDTNHAMAALAVGGKVYVAGGPTPGKLYMIDPALPAGPMTVAAYLGNGPGGLTFDGSRIWTANHGGSVSIVTLGPTLPFHVTTVGGFGNPRAVIYDGSSVWMADAGRARIHRLDAAGAVVQTVELGANPGIPVFDGNNLWVPLPAADAVAILNTLTGTVVATLPTGSDPASAAFDGERVLVVNTGDASVSLFRAADLAFVGTVAVPMVAGTPPRAACSDGLDFWVWTSHQLLRF